MGKTECVSERSREAETRIFPLSDRGSPTEPHSCLWLGCLELEARDGRDEVNGEELPVGFGVGHVQSP